MPVTDDDEYAGPVSMAATQSTTTKAEQRKSNKPIMEKRRRARINHCLNELKSLILNAMKKDPARHSKLEKADILEMTVKHLQNIQRQQLAAAVSADPAVVTRFRSGFDECAAEVSRYIARLEGVDNAVKQRLSSHLHRCMSSLQQMTPPAHSAGHDDNNNSSQRALLIPSRLATGELALVLPNYNSFIAAAPNSAFTAIKPAGSDSGHRRFQPFQVEIPNSHLKAHISIPDSFERQFAPSTSPKQFEPPTSTSMEPPQKHQVSSTEGMERLQPKPHPVYAPPDRGDPYNREHPHIVQKPFEVIERLTPTKIHQKPNPNYTLNPRVNLSPSKMQRFGDMSRGKQDFSEPHAKVPKLMVQPHLPPIPPAQDLRHADGNRVKVEYSEPYVDVPRHMVPPSRVSPVPLTAEHRHVVSNMSRASPSTTGHRPPLDPNAGANGSMWRPW